jgi:uncharacterized protein
MTVLPVTTLSSGILGILYVVLSVQVSVARNKIKIPIGDGSGKPGAEALLVAVRAQGNFAEYVPLALILLGGIEFAGASHRVCEAFAAFLVLSRLLHPTGLRRPAPNVFRASGAILIWLVILGLSIEAIFLSV